MASLDQLLRFAFATQPSMPQARDYTQVYVDCLQSIADGYRAVLNREAICNIQHFRNWSAMLDEIERLNSRYGA